jgi:hypothetical protein
LNDPLLLVDEALPQDIRRLKCIGFLELETSGAVLLATVMDFLAGPAGYIGKYRLEKRAKER